MGIQMSTISATQVLSKAKSHAKKGKKIEAANLYLKVLSAFPENNRALDGLKITHESIISEYMPSLLELYEQGNYQKVINDSNAILEEFTHAVSLWTIIGASLAAQGKFNEALEPLKKALHLKPDYDGAHNIGIALSNVIFFEPSNEMQEIITKLLDYKTAVRPRDISIAAISLLKLDPKIQNLFGKKHLNEGEQSINKTIFELTEIKLLLKLMSICPIFDTELEDLLIKVRSNLLLNISDLAEAKEVYEFQSALALQCFTNEYIFDQTEEEYNALELLDKSVENMISKGVQPSTKEILCLASYKATRDYKWCDSLKITTDIEHVFLRQVSEPRTEETLRSSISILNKITNQLSLEVRNQYESSPYPRWVNVGLHQQPHTISGQVAKSKLRLFDDNINQAQDLEILIAGCGTGQQSVCTSTRFKNAKILAVDLSLSSLAYAKRKTEELGLKNIDYMQADILDLGNIIKKFDIIECTGVLHHMDEPIEGWKVLIDCLKPGGLMKIGLYSKLARQHIVKIRDEIALLGLKADDVDIRAFRQEIINSPKEHHKTIISSGDFYSMSELRDLIFHVQEHQFTLQEIQSCLDSLGLKFCGFEDLQTIQKFQESNPEPNDPYDLDKWDIYEKNNPRVFSGMYQFWCQKVG